MSLTSPPHLHCRLCDLPLEGHEYREGLVRLSCRHGHKTPFLAVVEPHNGAISWTSPAGAVVVVPEEISDDDLLTLGAIRR